jgi:hypothetical protein
VGALIFTGLDALTGYGTFSLAIPSLPAASAPTLAEFGWALAIGVAAAGLSAGLRWLALRVRDGAGRRLVPVTTLLGLVMAGLAILYAQLTGHPTSNVLFSGQAALPGLIDHSADYTVGALVLLLVCKGLAYVAALSGFRGGPTFPAMFIGAAGGIALPPARTVARRRRGDGAGRDDRRHAPPPDVRRAAHDPVPRLRRLRGHAPGHRRDRGLPSDRQPTGRRATARRGPGPGDESGASRATATFIHPGPTGRPGL